MNDWVGVLTMFISSNGSCIPHILIAVFSIFGSSFVNNLSFIGERPFRWNKWTKNFKEARSLRSHMKTHSKDSDEIKEEPKEILKPIPYYKEIDIKEELVSTMLSE